ncbi:signal peptidase I [Actinophytocola sp. NPDC049390]|uniref:signal peptidase I n=1 Tax=Actinophytocola sp. NPDC049390 TaxID=3363894 RepID=UPI00378FCED0
MRIVLAAAVTLAGLIVVLGAIVLARPSYVDVEVAGAAMAPTLRAGDRVAVDTEAGPRRGDMVVVDVAALSDRSEGLSILRVIGVGGDRLECADGRLTVNGATVREPYASGKGPDFTVTVPDGTVFLAGDARDNAVDSRMSTGDADRGAIPVDAVEGRVVAVNGTVLDGSQGWLVWVAGGAVVALAGLGWLIVGLHRRTALPARPAD